MTSSREVALVGRNTKSIDLGIGMLDGAGTDSGESLPEPSKARQ